MAATASASASCIAVSRSPRAATASRKSAAGTRAIRSTQSIATPAPPSASVPSAARVTGTTSRYMPGACGALSSSSRSAVRRRSAMSVKS